ENGILVRGGEALELARKVDTVVLDKTGTITQGTPEVVAIHTQAGFNEDELLGLVAAAETQSEHPLGQAIVDRARTDGIALPAVTQFDSVTGKGIIANVGGHRLAIGNASLMQGNDVVSAGLA